MIILLTIGYERSSDEIEANLEYKTVSCESTSGSDIKTSQKKKLLAEALIKHN